MKLINRFIPYDCYKDIYCIDYNKLYSEGVKIILFDLDNTIQKNTDKVPSPEAIELINELKQKGFKVFILSNNSYERISSTLKIFGIEGFARSKKPLKKGYKKALKVLQEQNLIRSKEEVVAIGDQVLTDILGANKMGLKNILVKPIELKTEKWYTKLNRNTEKMIIKKMKKNYKEKYEKIMSILGD